MMRVLAFAALVGAVKAGLTSDGLACDATGTSRVVSDLCGVEAIATKVATEVAAATSTTCTTAQETTCACWNCVTDPETTGLTAMVADNTEEQKTLAAALTVIDPVVAAGCSMPCFGTAMDGPVKVPVGTEFPLDGFSATASWCGLWDDRQAAGGVTCAESIFDAKGLLFLTIIGGALAIIFFQCSIMAIVAATSGSKKGDAKP